MKLFTDEKGRYQMYIPLNWEYRNPYFFKSRKAPDSFGGYNKGVGAFQLSCKRVNNHISALIAANNLIAQASGSGSFQFKEKIIDAENFTNYTWMCAVDDHFFLITYIFDSKKKKKIKVKKELTDIRKILPTIKFIKPRFRNIVIAEDRFCKFVTSIAATIDLRNKAIENKAFIEFVVLANHIDALLRLALVLTNQLENKNKNIDTTILFQSKIDKPIMEKEIYKRAIARKIIDKDTYNELLSLYNERNKVMHRYVITDIKTDEVKWSGLSRHKTSLFKVVVMFPFIELSTICVSSRMGHRPGSSET